MTGDALKSQRYIEVKNIPENIPGPFKGVIPGIILDVLQTISLPLYQLGLDPRLINSNNTIKWTKKDISVGTYDQKNPSNEHIFIQYCLEKEWLLNNINKKIKINNKYDKVYRKIALLWLDSHRYPSFTSDNKTPAQRLDRIKLNDNFLTECRKISGVSDYPVTETLRIYYYGKCIHLTDKNNLDTTKLILLHNENNKKEKSKINVAISQAKKNDFHLIYILIQNKFGLPEIDHESEEENKILYKYQNLIKEKKITKQLNYILFPYNDLFSSFTKDNAINYLKYLQIFKKDYISSYKIVGFTKQLVPINESFVNYKSISPLFFICILILIIISIYIK